MRTFMEPGRSFSLSMGTSNVCQTPPIGISSAIVPDVSQRVFGGIGIDIIVIYNHSLRQFSLSPPPASPRTQTTIPMSRARRSWTGQGRANEPSQQPCPATFHVAQPTLLNRPDQGPGVLD